MSASSATLPADYGLPWRLEDLDLAGIQRERIADNEDLFFLLCSASYVESGSDLYSQNLIAHFAGDAELGHWLEHHWQHEELQHGRALGAYVRAVWPDFDWQRGLAAFWREYGAVCTAEQLESHRGLELAARCVVETGTASLYRALHEITDEPVLKTLTAHIKSDEVRHFKYFYQHYRRYRDREELPRRQVLAAIVRRVREVKSEDSDIALRHVFNVRYPQLRDDDAAFHRISHHAQALLRQHIPAQMTVKMLLKPLELPPRLQTTLQRPLAWLTEHLFLH